MNAILGTTTTTTIVSVIGAVLAVALALLLIWRVLATIQVGLYHAMFVHTLWLSRICLSQMHFTVRCHH